MQFTHFSFVCVCVFAKCYFIEERKNLEKSQKYTFLPHFLSLSLALSPIRLCNSLSLSLSCIHTHTHPPCHRSPIHSIIIRPSSFSANFFDISRCSCVSILFDLIWTVSPTPSLLLLLSHSHTFQFPFLSLSRSIHHPFIPFRSDSENINVFLIAESTPVPFELTILCLVVFFPCCML